MTTELLHTEQERNLQLCSAQNVGQTDTALTLPALWKYRGCSTALFVMKQGGDLYILDIFRDTSSTIYVNG